MQDDELDKIKDELEDNELDVDEFSDDKLSDEDFEDKMITEEEDWEEAVSEDEELRDGEEESEKTSETEGVTDVVYDSETLLEDDIFGDLNESLKQQVLDMDEEAALDDENESENNKGHRRLKKGLKITACVLLVFVLIGAFFFGTTPGKRIWIRIVANYIDRNVNHHESQEPDDTITPEPGATAGPTPTHDPEADATPIPIEQDDEKVRKEDYVKNILIFGIDQGNMDSVHSGSLNTDTIMIASINTKTKKVHLTSILRDTYVELEDGVGRKINSVYARGNRSGQGPELLMLAIENYFCIDLYGYAYVKLSSFEKIIDMLGGVTIELTAKEANYLNTTNYIVNPAYRNLVAGKNHLNGGQAVGYCRIRKVATLGGASNDYGRTLRQRRVLNAIFEKYKSQSIVDLFSVTEKCLSYITTDITNSDGKNQITELLEDMVINSITQMESHRLPLNDTFYDSGKKGYNGITYGLVITDKEANVRYLFEQIYGDTEEEAKMNYDKLKK